MELNRANLRFKNKHLVPFPCFFTSFLLKIQSGHKNYSLQSTVLAMKFKVFIFYIVLPLLCHWNIIHKAEVFIYYTEFIKSVNQFTALRTSSLQQPSKLLALFKDRPCLKDKSLIYILSQVIQPSKLSLAIRARATEVIIRTLTKLYL